MGGSISTGLNLPVAAMSHLNLLMAVGKDSSLVTKGDRLTQAIRQYYSWINELVRTHHCNSSKVQITHEIAWIWHVHKLHPVKYREDCMNAFGFLVDFNKFQTIKGTGDFSASINLEDAVVRQKKFIDSVTPLATAPYLPFKLGKLKRQYKQFMNLMKKYGRNHVLVPTVGIDLMWHSHMNYPASYYKYCIDLLGYQLDHNDEFSDGDLAKHLVETSKLWKQQHHTDYIIKKRPPKPIGTTSSSCTTSIDTTSNNFITNDINNINSPTFDTTFTINTPPPVFVFDMISSCSIQPSCGGGGNVSSCGGGGNVSSCGGGGNVSSCGGGNVSSCGGGNVSSCGGGGNVSSCSGGTSGGGGSTE